MLVIAPGEREKAEREVLSGTSIGARGISMNVIKCLSKSSKERMMGCYPNFHKGRCTIAIIPTDNSKIHAVQAVDRKS